MSSNAIQTFRWPDSGALRVKGGKSLEHTLFDWLGGLQTYMTQAFIGLHWLVVTLKRGQDVFPGVGDGR
jgi:hypothetical protein